MHRFRRRVPLLLLRRPPRASRPRAATPAAPRWPRRKTLTATAVRIIANIIAVNATAPAGADAITVARARAATVAITVTVTTTTITNVILIHITVTAMFSASTVAISILSVNNVSITSIDRKRTSNINAMTV